MGSFEALRLPCLEASHPPKPSEPVKFTVVLARDPMRRRRCMHGRRRCVHGLRGSVTLFRRHLPPLLAQLQPPFRRHLAESIEGLAHFALPVRR